MGREPLIMACCSDIAGQVRGKAFPARDFERRSASGIGWCPTNVQITAFDQIAPSPFGALGDLLLVPDPDTRVDVEYGPDDPGDEGDVGDQTIHRPEHGRPQPTTGDVGVMMFVKFTTTERPRFLLVNLPGSS